MTIAVRSSGNGRCGVLCRSIRACMPMTRGRAGMAVQSFADKTANRCGASGGRATAWNCSRGYLRGPAVRRAPQSGQMRSGCFGDGAGLGAGVAALRGSVFATGFSCCAFTLRMPAASLLDVLFMIAITPRSGLQLRGRPPCRGDRAHTHWCLPLRRCGRRRAGRDRRAGRGIPAPPALRA